MDLGLLYRALESGQVDMVAGNSTDGPIRALGFVVLEDDRHYFPPYEAVPLVREDSLQAASGDSGGDGSAGGEGERGRGAGDE